MKGILLNDTTGDLLIQNGRLQLGDNESQVTEHVLRAYPGEFKETPAIGAHVKSMLGGHFDPFWPGITRDMLLSQLVNVQRINVTDDSITVE